MGQSQQPVGPKRTLTKGLSPDNLREVDHLDLEFVGKIVNVILRRLEDAENSCCFNSESLINLTNWRYTQCYH